MTREALKVWLAMRGLSLLSTNLQPFVIALIYVLSVNVQYLAISVILLPFYKGMHFS